MAEQASRVIWFEELGRTDVARVGGKNASLGEMVRHLGQRGVTVHQALRPPPKPTGTSSMPTNSGIQSPPRSRN